MLNVSFFHYFQTKFFSIPPIFTFFPLFGFNKIRKRSPGGALNFGSTHLVLLIEGLLGVKVGPKVKLDIKGIEIRYIL